MGDSVGTSSSLLSHCRPSHSRKWRVRTEKLVGSHVRNTLAVINGTRQTPPVNLGQTPPATLRAMQHSLVDAITSRPRPTHCERNGRHKLIPDQQLPPMTHQTRGALTERSGSVNTFEVKYGQRRHSNPTPHTRFTSSDPLTPTRRRQRCRLRRAAPINSQPRSNRWF